MLKLNFSIELEDCSCNIKLIDTTMFKPANPSGFLAQDTSVSTNEYKITDGYFINVVYRRNPDKLLYVSEPIKIKTEDVKPDYEDNFPVENLNLPDGRIFFKRLFIIDKETYTSGRPSVDKKIIYYDESNNRFIKVEDSIESAIKLKDFILEFDDDYAGSFTEFNLLKLCNIKKCYNLLAVEAFLEKDKKSLSNNLCDNCSSDEDKRRATDLDFVFSALNVIDFLIECDNEPEALKMLDRLNGCADICSKINKSNLVNNSSGCGCS